MALKDISLREYGLGKKAAGLRAAYFRAIPEVCTERPLLITRYCREHGLFGRERISVLDRAREYRFVLENRVPVVRHCKAYEKCGGGSREFTFTDTSPFAGSTTSKFKGVPLYPEFMALSLWPELHSVSAREANPYRISPGDIDVLNRDVFPWWMNDTILELTRARCYRDNETALGKKNYAPELKLLEHLVFFLTSKPNCISHTIPDFSRALSRGLRSLIDEAGERARTASDGKKKEFYLAMGEAMEGIVSYSRRLASEAALLAGQTNDETARAEFRATAAIYRRVPEFPARTFREGLTTVWVCWTAVHLENPNVGLSLGRLDQTLRDIYLQDAESGALSIENALELLCYFYLKIGDHVPMVPEAGEQLFGGTGSNQAITIGGIDASGRDAVNDLTYIMLRAVELMKLRDPNLNARYYPGVNSRAYLRRLCEANISTGATPALHNDRAVIAGLTAAGGTLEQARDYGIIGCVEPGSNGRCYGHSGAILFNLASVLELTLYNGRHRHTGLDRLIGIQTGDPRSFSSFGDFTKAFETQARRLLGQALALNDMFGRVHQDFYPTPLLSSLFEGPMEKGMDLIEGGAAINGSGIALIGISDTADSLSAIEKVVFEEKKIDMATLLQALESDYAGFEVLQARLMNPDKTPKFGNEDHGADRNVTRILSICNDTVAGKRNYRGGPYTIGCWSMTNHAGFGRLTRALPSGRKAFENLSSGITPVSAVTPALTKMLNSVARLPPERLTNGFALNLKYTPEAGPAMLDNLEAAVEGYFTTGMPGGMEIQFNVTTHDTFVDAVIHPDDHRELLVRVSGYTAYFKDLNPMMQKEIIDRTEYLLSTSHAVHFEPFPLPSGAGR